MFRMGFHHDEMHISHLILAHRRRHQFRRSFYLFRVSSVLSIFSLLLCFFVLFNMHIGFVQLWHLYQAFVLIPNIHI